jgi:hypothetical protein
MPKRDELSFSDIENINQFINKGLKNSGYSFDLFERHATHDHSHAG